MKNIQKIAKEMNKTVKASDYDNQARLKVEHTSFSPLHRVDSGRNGVSSMLELQTVLTEAVAMYIETESRRTGIDIYIDSNVNVEHAFGRYKGIFLRLKDARGKYHSLSSRNEWDRNDIIVDRLLNVIKVENIVSYYKDLYAAYVQDERSKVISLFDAKDVAENPDWVNSRVSQQMQQAFAVERLRELIAYDQINSRELGSFNKLCEHAGVTVVRLFKYTQKFTIYNVNFINTSTKSIEIGWTQSNTYNSLPETLKVTLVKEVKGVRLRDLGIEGVGYYSGDDRMSIRPEQVQAAKKFAKQFKSKQRKSVAKLVEAA